jgi:hypothetical protein
MSLAELKLSTTAHRGHFTRTEKLLVRCLIFAEAQNTVMPKLEGLTMRNYMGELEDRLKTITGCIHLQISLDAQNENVYTQRLENNNDRYGAVMDRAMALQREVADAEPEAPVVQPPVHGPYNEPRKAKLAENQRPPTLNGDFKPAEFRLWLDKFDSFYNESELNKSEVVRQQNQLKMSISPELGGFLEQHMTEETPIYAPAGDAGAVCCISLLRREFLNLYPLSARRQEFLNAKHMHAEGQRFSVFCQQIRTKAHEGDLAAMSLDDLLTHRVMMGCEDPDLRVELLKIIDPTWTKVMLVTKGHEQALASQAQAPARAAAVQPQQSWGSNKKGGKTSSSSGGGNSAIDRKKAELKGKCFRCGSGKHQSAACPHKEKTCEKCQKYGHMSSVCLTSLEAGGGGTSGGARARTTKQAAPQQPQQQQASQQEEDPAAAQAAAALLNNAAEELVNRVSQMRIGTPTPPLYL